MRVLSMFLVAVMLMASGWLTSFDKAKEQSRKENKLILIYFSGEDWCYTCKQTRKQILERDAFLNYANNSLVLLNADFPRLNKKSISESQAKENKALADTYNPDMAIPAFVLVDADGKMLKKWQGNTGISAEDFVNQIKAAGH